MNLSPDKLDNDLTYKENAWFNALKMLSKQLLMKLFFQHKDNIKQVLINTGEEKTEGILPVELSQLLFEIIKFDDLQVVSIPHKDNNALEQALIFNMYDQLNKKNSKDFTLDLTNEAERMIQVSEQAAQKADDDLEEEEAEEELEVDTDG
jgi:hypothetical protein